MHGIVAKHAIYAIKSADYDVCKPLGDHRLTTYVHRQVCLGVKRLQVQIPSLANESWHLSSRFCDLRWALSWISVDPPYPVNSRHIVSETLKSVWP